MGIMDMFRPAPQQPAPAPAQGQQQPASQQVVPGSTMNQNNPGADPTKQQGSANSPLDSFASIWQNKSNSEGDPNTDPFSGPLFNADPNAIREAAGKADFLSSLPQELIQKAMSGNDPQAFLEVINKVAQNSLAMAVQLSTATAEQAGTKLGERFKKATPGMVKDAQLSGMRSDNPVLQNPAAEPMLQMIRERIRRNNPDLPAQEIQSQAEKFLTTFAQELSGTTKQSAEGTKQEGQDWAAWAGMNL